MASHRAERTVGVEGEELSLGEAEALAWPGLGVSASCSCLPLSKGRAPPRLPGPPLPAPRPHCWPGVPSPFLGDLPRKDWL